MSFPPPPRLKATRRPPLVASAHALSPPLRIRRPKKHAKPAIAASNSSSFSPSSSPTSSSSSTTSSDDDNKFFSPPPPQRPPPSVDLRTGLLPQSTTSTMSSSSNNKDNKLSPSPPPSPTPAPPPPQRPPPSFDLRTELLPQTRSIVASNWPQLLDLVDDGALVAVPRPADYVERRTDGYAEPELVLLVAAAHVSESSANAARRVVEATRPDAVVLELCGSRTGVLVADDDGGDDDGGDGDGDGGDGENRLKSKKSSNPFSLSGSILRSASLGGAPAMALRLLLARQSEAVLEAALSDEEEEDEDQSEGGDKTKTKEAKPSAFSRRPGVEARAAAAAARDVGATLVLGDRPIEITLRRAYEGLTWRERFSLGKLLLFGDVGEGGEGGGDGDGGGEEKDEETKEQEHPSPTTKPPTSLQEIDALSRDPTSLAAVVASLESSYPSLASALVHERDEWLSWSLARSRAVCGAKIVVGVLGAGHVRGVAWRLGQGDRCRPRFAELAGVGGGNGKGKSLSRKERALRRLAIEVGIAVALGLAWEAWERYGGGVGG